MANKRLEKSITSIRSVRRYSAWKFLRAALGLADWKANRDRPKRKREVGLGQLSPIFLIVLPVIEKLLRPLPSISPVFSFPSFRSKCICEHTLSHPPSFSLLHLFLPLSSWPRDHKGMKSVNFRETRFDSTWSFFLKMLNLKLRSRKYISLLGFVVGLAPSGQLPRLLYEDFYYWMSFVNVKYRSVECVVVLLALVARHKDMVDKGGTVLENPISSGMRGWRCFIGRVCRGW